MSGWPNEQTEILTISQPIKITTKKNLPVPFARSKRSRLLHAAWQQKTQLLYDDFGLCWEGEPTRKSVEGNANLCNHTKVIWKTTNIQMTKSRSSDFQEIMPVIHTERQCGWSCIDVHIQTDFWFIHWFHGFYKHESFVSPFLTEFAERPPVETSLKCRVTVRVKL